MLDFDEEYQWAMLSRCLNPKFWERVNGLLHPSMFLPDPGVVFTFIKRSYDKSDKPPSRTAIKQKFRLALPKADENTSESADLELIREVSSSWHLNDLIAKVRDHEDQGDLEDAWGVIAGCKGTPVNGEVRRINALLDDPNLAPPTRDTVATHIPTLDKKFGGGVGRKELAILAAPANRGKSSILAWIGGSAIKQGWTVTHLSLEMDDAQMAEKYRRRLLGLSLVELSNTGAKKRHNQLKKIAKEYGCDGLYIRQLVSHKYTVSDLRQFVQEDGTDLLIVDYSDHLRPTTKRTDKRLELAEIQEQLRALAVEEDIAVWDAAQVSRAAYAKSRAGMEDVAECIQKAHIADQMVTFNQNTSEGQSDSAGSASGRLHIAKNRYGPARDVIDVTVNMALCHVYEQQGDFA